MREELSLPDGGRVSYLTAELPSRAAAFMIDVSIQTLAMLGTVVLFLIGIGLGTGSGLGTASFSLHGAVPAPTVLTLLGAGVVVLFLLFFGYFIFFETVWRGQTPGKRLLSLRVVRLGGARIGPSEAVIRNLLRIADALPFGYGVGIGCIVLRHNRRRLRLKKCASPVSRVRRMASRLA